MYISGILNIYMSSHENRRNEENKFSVTEYCHCDERSEEAIHNIKNGLPRQILAVTKQVSCFAKKQSYRDFLFSSFHFLEKWSKSVMLTKSRAAYPCLLSVPPRICLLYKDARMTVI
jgi:hypothetical protein